MCVLDIDNLEVLIVDADLAAANTISDVLSQMGLEAVQVHNGYDANFEFYHRKPALVTVDLALAGMSGLEVIYNIKAMPNHATKILVVSDAVPSLLSKAKNAGADALLGKPIDQDSLRRMVRILLNLDQSAHTASQLLL